MDDRGEKYQAYCLAGFFMKPGRHRVDRGMLYIQLHAYNKIFITHHLYTHPERAGVDYIDHATN